MLKKLKKLFKDANMSGSVLVALAIAVIIISLFAGNEEKIFGNKTIEVETNITSLVSNIKDNYSLTVTKTVDGKETKYTYKTDNKLEEYEIDNKAYLVYKDKVFNIDAETFKIKKDKKQDFISDPYVNMELIKNVLSYCEYKYVNDTNSSCEVTIKDYMDEYKKIYNVENPTINQNININVSYFSTKIHSITIDYTTIDSLINGGVNTLKYKIVINDIDSNNFDEVYNYYKKELNK